MRTTAPLSALADQAINRAMFRSLAWVEINSTSWCGLNFLINFYLDIDECANNGSACDPVSSMCQNTVGSYNCTCLSGYEV